MVKIRLRRVGAKKKPSYRLVVADSRAPRDGAFIDVIGHYNPLTEPATIDIDGEKALNWLNQGAQPTDIVSKLLSQAGIAREPKAAKPKAAKPKARAAKKAKPAAKKAKPTKAAVSKKPKPTKASTTKKPKAKAGVTKKSKPTKEKT